MKQKMLFQAVLPWIAYFNICFFWGTSTVANKLGSTSMHPLMVGAVRFTVTTLLIALAAAARGVPLRITRRDWKALGTGSFLMYFLNTLLVLFAAVRVDASISTIVLCLIPVGLVLVDSLAQRHFDVGPPGVIGMAGGFAGVVIASASGLLGGGADIGGITLLLASVCVWSVGTIYLKNRTVEAPFILQIFCPVSRTGRGFPADRLVHRNPAPLHAESGRRAAGCLYGRGRFHHWAWLLHVPAQTVAHIGRFHLRIYQSDCRADDEPSCTA